jgi:hypothetical protein
LLAEERKLVHQHFKLMEALMRRLMLSAVLVTGALAIPNIACAQDIKIGFAGALTGPAAYVGLDKLVLVAPGS